MNEKTKDIVIGAFSDGAETLQAMYALEAQGIDPALVSVVMPEEAKEDFIELDRKSKAAKGATAGGLTGGLVGALALGLSAGSAVVLPGVGLVAAGPIVAAITGAGAGGALGGALGGLVGFGFSEYEAKFSHDILSKGGVIAVVLCPSVEVRRIAERVMKEHSVEFDSITSASASMGHLDAR